EVRQADPVGAGDAGEVDRLAPAQAVGADRIDDIGDEAAEQDRQAAQHAGQAHRDKADGHHGKQTDEGVEAAAADTLHGDRREVEADHRDDGAGHYRRHQRLDPAMADLHDDQANQRIDRAGGDDAAERHRNVRVGPGAGIGGGGDYHRDEGEARAEIARHLAAGDEKEDQRRDAREED